MTKYYTPDISEFHVGFEYEEDDNNTGNWVKQVVGFDNTGDLEFFKDDILEGNIRVKYLDKEDFESLGFELDHNHKNVRFNYLMFPYRIDYTPHENSISIFRWGEEQDIVSYITIKNKSELKRLLTQIGVVIATTKKPSN